MNVTQAHASLDKWQQRLEVHFKALGGARESSGLPVFAIEHGLDSSEVLEIVLELRSHLARGMRLGGYWLLWVVYASEMGYDYDGEEYWTSFEKRTPRWREDVDRRRQLRQWFLKFHKTYSGVCPTGPWATHFSIISWPITHALVPRDLQTQLARLLYEQRYFVAEFVDSAPSQVGHLLAASAYYSSSRLRNFLEQEALVGRIVLALLGLREPNDATSILDSTLQRVVSDLEAASSARVWLNEARSAVVKAKVRLAATRQRESESQGSLTNPANDVGRIQSKYLQPRLSLTREGPNSWAASVELPSFSGLAALSARLATFLRTTRCTVAGSIGTWHSRGWLLYGTQRERLLTWPEPKRPVVSFELVDETMLHLLASECRITSGPTWLFRVNKDGTATEVIGHQIRLGAEYVLLHTSEIRDNSILRRTNVSCNGITASRLCVHSNPSEEELQCLKKYEIKLQRTLRFWPIGLPPIHWDGEGHIEWFSGESLCIALSHDSACEGLSVQLDGRRDAEFIQVPANQPLLLNLGQLAPGTHLLNVAAAYKSTGAEKALLTRAQTTVTIRVRPPHRWVPGTTGHAGLIVTTDPHEPSLDGVLSGQTRVSVMGPVGAAVTFELELLNASGEVLSTESLGAMTLPMTEDDWHTLIEARTRREHDPEEYLRASAGRLIVDGEHLGLKRVPLSHRAIPIRWLAKGAKSIELTLTNDTGHEDPVAVSYATFLDPTTAMRTDGSNLSNPISPSGHGGLYLAAAGSARAGIVVSVPGRVGLQDLVIVPRLGFALSNGSEVATLLGWIRDWSLSRTIGPFSLQRRACVLLGMKDQLFESMCLAEWIQAERGFRTLTSNNAQAQARLENAVDQRVSFALGLSRAKDEILTNTIEDSARNLLHHASLHRVCADLTLCEAALRLSATPEYFADWAASNTVKFLDALVKMKPLLRGSRMVALLSGDEGKRRVEGWTS